MTALAKGQTNIACEPLLTNRRVEFFTERLAVRPPPRPDDPNRPADSRIEGRSEAPPARIARKHKRHGWP